MVTFLSDNEFIFPSLPRETTMFDARAPPRNFFIEGDGFMGTQTNPPPKFSFSSDFGHFILKMLKNAKF